MIPNVIMISNTAMQIQKYMMVCQCIAFGRSGSVVAGGDVSSGVLVVATLTVVFCTVVEVVDDCSPKTCRNHNSMSIKKYINRKE